MINTFPNEGAVLLDIEPVPGLLITALSLKSAPQAKEYSWAGQLKPAVCQPPKQLLRASASEDTS